MNKMRMRVSHLILKVVAILMVSGIVFSGVSSTSSALIGVVNEFPSNNEQMQPEIYLSEGPDYVSERNLGLFGTSETGSPPNIINGTVIFINNSLDKMAVLETNSTIGGKIYLWINGTLPAGVILYTGFSATTLRNYSSGTRMTLKPKSPDEYFGFGVSTTSSTVFTLFFDYQLSQGICVTYEYLMYVNE